MRDCIEVSVIVPAYNEEENLGPLLNEIVAAMGIVGCSYEPMVWVTLETVTRVSMLEFEDAVRGVPEIVEVARMMGQPDYLVRVVTSDADHFESLYIDVLANLPHVEKLTSQLAMKIIKRTTELPLRQSGTNP